MKELNNCNFSNFFIYFIIIYALEIILIFLNFDGYEKIVKNQISQILDLVLRIYILFLFTKRIKNEVNVFTIAKSVLVVTFFNVLIYLVIDNNNLYRIMNAASGIYAIAYYYFYLTENLELSGKPKRRILDSIIISIVLSKIIIILIFMIYNSLVRMI